MRSPSRIAVVAVLALLGPAHTGASAQAASGRPVVREGPILVLQDSVVLQETDDRHLGEPNRLFVGPDGSYTIVDGFSARLVRFGRNGRWWREYGRSGEGPGEFREIGFAGFVDDRVVASTSGSPPLMRLNIFELSSGDYLGSADIEGLVTTLVASGRRLWAAGIDLDDWWGLGSMRLRRLPGQGGSGRRAPTLSLDQVAVPRPYRENMEVLSVGGPAVVDVGDDILLGWTATPFLLRVDHDGTVLDTIPLQSRLRRGVPPDDDLINLTDLGETPTHEAFWSTYDALTHSFSWLLAISRGKEGEVHTVHDDAEVVGPRYVNGTLFVSSIGSSAQCADTLVPTSGTGRPLVVLRDSDLFVLERHLGAEGVGGVRTVVRRYAIDASACSGDAGMSFQPPGPQ